MPTSSSVQAARKALADRLRDIRLDAGLTAIDLARSAGWHRTKVSKLEHAVTSPSAEDIKLWCRVCDAADQAPDLIASLRAADSMWTEWRRMERAGLRAAQASVIPLWEATRRFRIYSPWLIPSPLQTEGYVRALLTATRERRGVAVDDVEEAVAVRLARQHVLHEGDHTFAVILEENVLRHRIGGADVLRVQLKHLQAVAALPALSLGIVPLSTDRELLRPVEMFFLFDDAQVNVELVSGWLRLTQPREVAMYADGFARLASMAVYGSAAQDLIHRAIRVL